MPKTTKDFIVYFSQDAPDRAHLRESINAWKARRSSDAELVELSARGTKDFAATVKRRIQDTVSESKERDIRLAVISGLHSVDHISTVPEVETNFNFRSNGVIDVLKGLKDFLSNTKRNATAFFAFRSIYSSLIPNHPIRPLDKESLKEVDLNLKPKNKDFGYFLDSGYFKIRSKFVEVLKKLQDKVNIIPKANPRAETRSLFKLLDTAFSRPLVLESF